MLDKPLLRADIIEAGYPGYFQIRNIKINIKPGELLVITGRSGSGKTTLIKTLLGIINVSQGYYKGKIEFLGKDLKKHSPREIYSKISYIPQDPWYAIIGHIVYVEYCHALSVAEKKCEPNKLAEYGLGDHIEHITYGLSAGQYQKLLWAESFDRETKLIVMDEPLVYLDTSSKNYFRKLVEKHLDKGGSVIIVDHMPETWKSLEPKLLILNNGKQVYYGPYREDVVPRPKKPVFDKTYRSKAREELIVAKNIFFSYPGTHDILKGANLTLHKGEILGIKGANGAGKTTLLKIIAGIYKPRKGVVIRNGYPIYVPENPLLYFSYPTPYEELYSASRDPVRAVKEAEKYGLERVLKNPLAVLSTGEKRRLALLAAYLSGYDIYLLDEPSGGLDTYSLNNLLEILFDLRRKGKGIIVASHDPRLDEYYDSICVLHGGRLECH